MRIRDRLSLLSLLGVKWVGGRAETAPIPGKWLPCAVTPPFVAITYVDAYDLVVEVFHQYNPTFYQRVRHDLGECPGCLSAFAERMARMAIERLSVQGQGSGRQEAATDAQLARTHPTLFEYLTALSYADGTERQPCTLLVFTGDGEWKACLNDRDADAHLWASGKTLGALLATMEERLCDDCPGWRAKRADGKTGKRK